MEEEIWKRNVRGDMEEEWREIWKMNGGGDREEEWRGR